MRIDSVTFPQTQGKNPQEVLEILVDFCQDAQVRIMRLNNEIEDLKHKVATLEQRQR